jgi:hypothetical protein
MIGTEWTGFSSLKGIISFFLSKRDLDDYLSIQLNPDWNDSTISKYGPCLVRTCERIERALGEIYGRLTALTFIQALVHYGHHVFPEIFNDSRP